jgi:GWxTD domain-containing protein
LIAIIGDFNIEGLPSGNYHFRLDVIDKNNKVLATKRSYFQRSNPQTGITLDNPETIDKLIIQNTFIEKVSSPDTLNDYLKCLMPIANDKEKGVLLDVIKSADTTMKMVIFFTFWKSRNHLEPENEWLTYRARVQYANKAFGSTIKKGYESDRGRVFLQYGEPNDFQKSNHEPSAYPYEIWHYYTIGNQRNKRFVFYNPMLTGNDFVLLHSDVQGEIYDKNWERRLHERNNTMYDHDATNSDSQWGSKAKENFNK